MTQGGFDETFDFVTGELGQPRLDMVLVRKQTDDPAFRGPVDLTAYRAAADRLQALERRRAGHSPLRRLLAQRVRAERAVIAEHHRGNPVLDGCVSGTLTAVIDETGAVLPCEMRDEVVGELRAVDFDFLRIWHGERAEAARRRQRERRCHCTFETGVRTTLSFRPWKLAGLLRR